MFTPTTWWSEQQEEHNVWVYVCMWSADQIWRQGSEQKLK